MKRLDRAIRDLRMGKFVLIHDSDEREAETDMVVASEFVTRDSIRRMRMDGGGLICTTVYEKIYTKLGLPFMTDIYSKLYRKYPVLAELVPDDIPYDAKSAFSITINHRKTFTGITDIDRALTISEFAKLARRSPGLSPQEAKKEFGRHFRAPGHVHLLNAAKGLLDSREGHTELTTALMIIANLTPSATICEMMYYNGLARPLSEAIKYAKGNDLVLLSGNEIIQAWKESSNRGK